MRKTSFVSAGRRRVAMACLAAALGAACLAGVCGCSAQPASQDGGGAGASETTAASSEVERPANSSYQAAGEGIKITDAIDGVDVAWKGGTVTIQSVPAQGVTAFETADGDLSGDATMYYAVSDGILHIKCSNPNASGVEVPDKDLIVNLPAASEMSKAIVSSEGAYVKVNVPGAKDVAVAAADGAVDVSAGETLKACSLKTSSGNISLTVPPTLGFRANVASTIGSAYVNVGSKNSEGVYVNGDESASIALESNSGDIILGSE